MYIYKGTELIESLNYTKEEFKKEWYPKWEDTMIISNVKFLNPILENDKLREKTREECILLDNKLELLGEGEYISKNKILKKEIPENLISPIWNKEKKVWEENMTREQMIELRKNKIVEYEKLEEEKKLIEGSKFASEDEIKVIVEKMTVLEGNINNLQEKIKAL